MPGTRKFALGEQVTIDCGARFGGYHTDMTRTVAVGAPTDWQGEIYDLAAAAQAAGVEAAISGSASRCLDVQEFAADGPGPAEFSH